METEKQMTDRQIDRQTEVDAVRIIVCLVSLHPPSLPPSLLLPPSCSSTQFLSALLDLSPRDIGHARADICTPAGSASERPGGRTDSLVRSDGLGQGRSRFGPCHAAGRRRRAEPTANGARIPLYMYTYIHTHTYR